MKKLLFASLFSVSLIGAFAQAPMRSDTLDATGVIVLDTTGGAKQVPNDPSFDNGERRTSTDSTRTRYAQTTTSRDAGHIKKHPARKDTTHVPQTTTTKKTTRNYHRHSASTTTNKKD